MAKWTKTNPSPDILFSMAALRRAWQVVRRSGPSPGVDGVTMQSFAANLDAELNRLRQQICAETYVPESVRRIFIKKSSGKERPISIWTVRDRVAQRVVLDFLAPYLEQIFLPCSYGFRQGISTKDAAAAVSHFRDSGRIWVLDADIHDCFGSIDCDLLMGQVRRVVHSTVSKNLLHQWLRTPIKGFPGQEAQVSQGGVISPMLANLYLHRFDEMAMAALPQSKLVRFADDFIVLSRTEEEAVWSLEVARRSLANLRLNLNMRKTRILHFEEGFEFLGFAFKGNQYRNLSTGA
ncbi:hypothetical protein G4Y79_14540 [Phototrophicus methaneseepsis]|uniref:Reverse transcriptase domain-containing protein n=1 Tax=Phototrophicus methaneseepsis TaxID=2710758 RepID=A0A7S8ID26_9CHLR|nr:reverse transcriptase domain-containing protein [Phototrophicus methaneseepsis]QPC80924.1 hypothetical protein G4Y79_14540 [Phototrophicus methaneseepsis]